MNMETVGKQIASLRRKRAVKQEELANYVGVTTQAVSKWENGGVPDIELLPKIADFFGVSIDSLFGRNIADYSDLQSAMMKKIHEASPEKQFSIMFEYCWDMERALMEEQHFVENESVEEYQRSLRDKDAQHYSSVMTDHGFTRMGIGNRSQYFLVVPDAEDAEKAYFGNIDYAGFFKDLSDKNVLDACILLNKREHQKAFTTRLFEKNLGIEKEKADEIIRVLTKYHLLSSMQIEMDDEVQTVYHFSPTPSFVALLIFAREMIDKPDIFSYYHGGRKKSYLQ